MLNEFKNKIDIRIAGFRLLQEESNSRAIFSALEFMTESLEKGNKILVFGNGGSATQASHFAAELVNKFYFERKPLCAISLASDIANLTSIANDSEYKYIFSRQLEALGKPGDVALGITTSGRSPNVLDALDKARKMNMKTIALCGNNTAPLIPLDIHAVIPIPLNDTPTIQELHLFILHTWAELLEKKFFSGEK
jgi:D-sedoheptulose 7-phosphate isomerase